MPSYSNCLLSIYRELFVLVSDEIGCSRVVREDATHVVLRTQSVFLSSHFDLVAIGKFVLGLDLHLVLGILSSFAKAIRLVQAQRSSVRLGLVFVAFNAKSKFVRSIVIVLCLTSLGDVFLSVNIV